MTNDIDELFGEQDFDQKKLEKEALLRPALVIEKREEKPVEEKASEAPSKPMAEKQLYIIDGYALIYRSYYAFFNNPMKDPAGNNISAVYGFFTTLLKLLRENNPHYMVVAMDSHGPTFRHKMYEPYKANRESAPEDLHSQVPIINAILKALEIPMVEMVGFEADDIIATLSDEASAHSIDTIMVTGDKDLLQLVDEHTFALRPARKGETHYRMMGIPEVQEEFGVLPTQVVDYLSLLGDASDNIPGVKGIGAKGAAKLLQQFGTLEGIYKNLRLCAKGVKAKLEEGEELAKLSKSLVELRRDLFKVDSFDTEQYLLDDLNYKAAVPLFEEIGMKSIVRELDKLANGGVAPKRQEKVSKAMNSSDKGSYEGVLTLARLEVLLAQAEKEGGIIAFDMETDSLDSMAAKPLGFSFSWVEGIAYYVPIISDGERLFSDEDVKAVLSKYFSTGRLSLVGQNIKYDYKVLVNWGVVPKTLAFDTMVGAWLLESTGVFNMDFLAEKYLEYKTLSYKDAVPKGKSVADIPQEQAIFYGAEDADITFRLYKLFKNLLVARNLLPLMENLEMPLLRIIANMEIEGIFLDRTLLEPLTEEFEGRIGAIQAEIFAICGREFNLNSPKQLQEVLFVEREIPTGAKTRTGFSTATDVLEPLSATYPEVALVLEYRTLNKLKSTYIDKLPLDILERTGRIHPTFSQTGTETGRLSCKDPNLQNIPVRTEEGRRIRSSFVPKEGYLFLSADYSQIELVVLAHMADDPGLKGAFLKGIDVHSSTASLIFDVPLEEVTGEQRRVAKTINFGVMYGMGPHSLSGDLKITHAEAKAFIDQYFARYSAVKTFIEKTREDAAVSGVVSTLLGHRRTITEINSSNRIERAKAERIAVNTVIQGSAADIMKVAMLRIDNALREHSPDTRLLLQIHDELVFEVPEGELKKVHVLVKEAMEGAVKLSLPLRASIETGKSWGEIH